MTISPPTFNIPEHDRPDFRDELDRLFSRQYDGLIHPQTFTWNAVQYLIVNAGNLPQILSTDRLRYIPREMPLTRDGSWYLFNAGYQSGTETRRYDTELELRVNARTSAIQLLGANRRDRRIEMQSQMTISGDFFSRYEDFGAFNTIRHQYSREPSNYLRIRRTAIEQSQYDFDTRMSAVPESVTGEARSLGGLFGRSSFEARIQVGQGERLLQMMCDRENWIPPIPIACQGCFNYHGKSYNGNMLVCAIHPSGIGKETTCDDFDPTL